MFVLVRMITIYGRGWRISLTFKESEKIFAKCKREYDHAFTQRTNNSVLLTRSRQRLRVNSKRVSSILHKQTNSSLLSSSLFRRRERKSCVTMWHNHPLCNRSSGLTYIRYWGKSSIACQRDHWSLRDSLKGENTLGSLPEITTSEQH